MSGVLEFFSKNISRKNISKKASARPKVRIAERFQFFSAKKIQEKNYKPLLQIAIK